MTTMLMKLGSQCLFFLCGVSLSTMGDAVMPGDEPLDTGAAAFYAVVDKTKVSNNASIGLLGLTAPKGKDFFAFGLAVAEGRSHYDEGVEGQGPDNESLLEVKWDGRRMACWMEDYEPFDQDPQCAPVEEAVQTLRENTELLSRYRQVQRMTAAPVVGLYRASPFITAVKLTAVKIKVDLREGSTEAA